MLIAQITDSHLRAAGVRLFGAVDAFGALERALERIARLDPRPDAEIHTGDLANDGDEADHAALAELLERLEIPVLAVPGNHDRRDLLRRHLSPLGAVPADGPLRHAADLGPVRLIGLDSLVEGEAGGRLGAEQLAWLDTTLSGASDRPTLIFLHHPPVATGIGFMDAIMLADHAAFADVVGGHRQVGMIACGHVHRAVQSRFAGTVCIVSPGVAHQVAFDLRPGAPSRWVAEPPAMTLHRWTPDWGFVSQLVYIDRHGDEATFEAPDALVS